MRYPVMQSGFISLTEVGVNSPKLETTSFSETILGQQVDNSLTDYFYSVDVEKLISIYKNSPSETKMFEFREQVINVAFKSFATIAISQWVEMQSLRPTLGRLHKEFIIDTLLFVYYGKPRSVETFQWARLLFPESGGNLQIKLTTLFSDKYRKAYPAITGDLTRMEECIQRWIRQPDGIYDLLKTLHVIFGKRAGAGAHQNR